MAVTLIDLTRHLDDLLVAARFSDYSPNGLQVEGRGRVARVVTAVSANQAAIEAAIAARADAMVVHHGFFWRNEDRTIVGHRARRLSLLLANEVSLLAYHLPLDAHPELGNNVGLLQALAEPVSLTTLTGRLEVATGRPPLVFPAGSALVRRIAAVSGGGAGFFEEAAAAGVDLFVTGEPSEMAQGLAAELRVSFAAAGHHGTERFGPRALGGHLAAAFDLEVSFVDIPNPV